jgi:hypothetical protein
MRYRTEQDLEIAAEQTRAKLGISDQTNPDMMTLIVKMKSLGMIKNYRRVPDEQMPFDEALFDSINGILDIPERTFSAMNRGIPRAAMTIAEEIGHIALKHGGVRHRSTNHPADPRPDPEKIDPKIRREEAEARRFAAAFLAPHDLAGNANEISAEGLARKFNLSFQAANIRKEELDRLYRRKHGVKRRLPSSIERFLREAKAKGHRIRSLDDE